MDASSRISKKYSDLFNLKDENYGTLSEDKCVVFFIDGKNVTKNHKDYPMLGTANFTKCLFECAKRVVRDINTSALIYAAIDELTIIFTNPSDVFSYFGVGGSTSCICGLLVQRIFCDFQLFYKCYFKPVVFQLNECDIKRWISYRKEVCNIIGVYYIAKEYLPKNLYRDKDLPDVLNLLREHDLIRVISSNRYICDGYYSGQKKQPTHNH